MPESPLVSLRIGFAGTPEFAATLLSGLIDAGYRPELVLTQPDRPTGRGRKTRPSPVRQVADAAGIAVETPVRLKGESLEAHQLDLLIVAAYGLILPPHILSAPRLGCLNVHASLLPRWRGAAPVERALIAGDAETGVCLMQMDAGLDTGPVFSRESVEIRDTETGGQLEARLVEVGLDLLVRLLPELETQVPEAQPDAGATYAEKLSPVDSEPKLAGAAEKLARQVRALSDRQPVALFAAENDQQGPVRIRCLGPASARSENTGEAPGTIVGIDKAGLWLACGDGTLCIPQIQLNRGKGTAMTAKAAANGYPGIIHVGAKLISQPATDPGAGP